MKVVALEPVLGSYPCAAGVADHIQQEVEDKDGAIVMVRRAYKRFVLQPPHTRHATETDVQNDKLRPAGTPSRLSGPEGSQFIQIRGSAPIDLPDAFLKATGLIDRGLVIAYSDIDPADYEPDAEGPAEAAATAADEGTRTDPRAIPRRRSVN